MHYLGTITVNGTSRNQATTAVPFAITSNTRLVLQLASGIASDCYCRVTNSSSDTVSASNGFNIATYSGDGTNGTTPLTASWAEFPIESGSFVHVFAVGPVSVNVFAKYR